VRAASRSCRARLALAVSIAACFACAGIASAAGGGVGAASGSGGQAAEPGGGGGVVATTEPGFGPADYSFPLSARHTYGDGFGAGRGHEGQDLFARCGSAVLATRGGRIQEVGFEPRAGNYVVVDGRATAIDTMYAHLLSRSPMREGTRVMTGGSIGRVGSSGNASGCHLHFEIWSAPGWYEGGEPMPSVGRLLRAWDTRS